MGYTILIVRQTLQLQERSAYWPGDFQITNLAQDEMEIFSGERTPCAFDMTL